MYKYINESKRIFTIDYFLVAILVLCGVASVIGIYFSSPLNNFGDVSGDIKRQIMWFGVSAAFLVFLIRFGIDRIFTITYAVYWILLVLLFFQVLARFGIINTRLIPAINGAHAWYVIPSLGSFQPSEFMKVALIFISANIVNQHNQNKESFSFSEDVRLAFNILKFAVPALFLIILQPDTGIPIVIMVSLTVMFLMSGVRREWFLIMAIAVALVFGVILFLYYNNQAFLIKLFGGGYRLNRFYGWLDFEKYANNQGHHLYNALGSIGTAGWSGHNLGSVILQYPESSTDFVFAVIAQNFGFMGASLVILLICLLDVRLALIAYRSDLPREKALLSGALGMLIFQHFQNIGMVLGLLPITGITLPFISYGGSSTVSYMIPMSVAFYMYSEIQNAHKH